MAQKKDITKLSARTSPAVTTHLASLAGPENKMQEQRRDSTSLSEVMREIKEMGQRMMEMKVDLTDNILKSEERVSTDIRHLSDQMIQMNTKMASLQDQMEKTKEEIKEVKKENKKTGKKITELEDTIVDLQRDKKDLEEIVLKQAMENASCMIRLQNCKEEGGENTYEKVLTWIQSETEIEIDFLRETIDAIYRVNSSYARRNKKPREIVIKFNRRNARDRVLKELEIKERVWEAELVKVLREVPWKLREKRRVYKEFAATLRRNNIKYKWLIPEGLFFIYKARRYTLNSWMKVQEFLDRFEVELGGYKRHDNQEDVQSLTKTQQNQRESKKKTETEDIEAAAEKSHEEEVAEEEKDDGGNGETEEEELGAVAPKIQRVTRKTTQREIRTYLKK